MSRGRPAITIRMPRHIIDGLQDMASKQGLTVSDVIRALVEEELKCFGYSVTEPPLEGQMSIDD